MNREEAIQIIRASPLSRLEDYVEQGTRSDTINTGLGKLLPVKEFGAFLIDGLQESIRIRPVGVDPAELALGASRFGGPADLPPGFVWPTWMAPLVTKANQKGPPVYSDPVVCKLHLIAQINLAELNGILSESPLPDRGMLYFFVDLRCQAWAPFSEGDNCSKVSYSDIDPKQLIRLENPPEAEGFPIQACKLSFDAEFTFCSNLIPLCKFSFEKQGKDFFSYVTELQMALSGNSDRALPRYRMLGHADILQDDPRGWLQSRWEGLARYPAYNDPERLNVDTRAKDWVPLLQLDSPRNKPPGWMWGDMGMIYFYIRKQDLRERRFDQTRFHFECC
jgi:uncharacterized protein YwqG